MPLDVHKAGGFIGRFCRIMEGLIENGARRSCLPARWDYFVANQDGADALPVRGGKLVK